MIIPSIHIVAILYLGSLFVLISAGVWLGVAVGTVAFASMLFLIKGGGPHLFIQLAYNQLHGFVLTAVPVFIFMGEILLRTDISGKLYSGISGILSRVPGGLLHVNVFSSAIFAAVSGTSTATVAAIGSVAVPELEKRGYQRKWSLGSLAIAGTLGMMIPPSVPLILYSFMTGTSVGKLFIAGIVPGIILTCMFSGLIIVQSIRYPDSIGDLKKRKIPFIQALKDLLGVFPVAILIIIILGSIYMGIATPTEAAGIGVLGSLLISLVQRKFTWKALVEAAKQTAILNAIIGIIIMGALGMSFSIAHLGVGRHLVSFITSLPLPPIVIIFLLYIFYIILGCFMDGISLILITLPIVYPVVTSLGYDPIWFGIALVVALEIAMVTPPIGVNLWILQGISEESMHFIVLSVIPFLILSVIFLLILTFIPQIATWLPSIM